MTNAIFWLFLIVMFVVGYLFFSMLSSAIGPAAAAICLFIWLFGGRNNAR